MNKLFLRTANAHGWRIRTGLGFALICALVLLAYFVFFRGSVSRSSRIYSGTVETREIQIGSKVGGRVTRVAVEEGDSIRSGTLLVAFECNQLKAELEEAQAKQQQAQADLERLKHGYRPEEIAQAEALAQQQLAALQAARNGARPQEISEAEADYAAAEADAVNAETDFGRMEMLVRGETISRQQFDQAKMRRDSTTEKAKAAAQRLSLIKAGTRPEDLRADEERYRAAQASADQMRSGYRREDVEAAEGRLAEAKGHVEEVDAQLREATLFAPANGVVQVVSVRPGDLVPANRIVMTMLQSSEIWVRIYVPETDLSRIRLGQPANINVDSLPGRSLSGQIQEIASQAEFIPRNVQTPDDREHQVFGVKVYVNDPQHVLKSGMSATVQLK